MALRPAAIACVQGTSIYCLYTVWYNNSEISNIFHNVLWHLDLPPSLVSRVLLHVVSAQGLECVVLWHSDLLPLLVSRILLHVVSACPLECGI